MTREEAIEKFEAWAECKYEPTRQAALMAISALRTQQTHAKLDRNRWDGCDICTGVEEADWQDGIRFCPGCGKPITEEACAALERRISDGTDDNKT